MPTVSDLKQQARTFEQRGQLGKALAVYQHILKHLEGTPALAKVLPLYVKVGDLLLRLDRTDEALTAYERAAEQYAELGSAQRVSALCEKILRVAPELAGTYVRLAHRLVQHGHVGSARDVLADYTERAHLERAAEALDDLAGRPSEEIRPMLERLLASLERGAARAERDAERVSTQLSRHTDAAAGELASLAAMEVATPSPESAEGRSAYTFDTAETHADRPSEPEPLAPHLIDFGDQPNLPASPAGRSSELEIDHQTPAPEPPPSDITLPGEAAAELEIDHRTPAPEPPLEIEPAGGARPPEITPPGAIPPGFDIEHRAPAPERPLDLQPIGDVMSVPTGPRRAAGSEPPASAGPAPRPGPAAPAGPERKPTPRTTIPRVATPQDTRPGRDLGVRRRVIQARPAQRHKRPVVLVLAGFAAGVVAMSGLFLSGLLPIGGGDSGSSSNQSQAPGAVGTQPPAPVGAPPRVSLPPSTPTLTDTMARAVPSDSSSPSGAAPGETAPDSGANHPIVIGGLEIESVGGIQFRGQAGYRVVHLLDSGDALTVESYFVGNDTTGTSRIGRISVNITPPDTVVGIVRLERYLVYASGRIAEDSLRTLMARLVELKPPD